MRSKLVQVFRKRTRTNLVNDKKGIETRLNGGNPNGVTLYSPRAAPTISPLFCLGSSSSEAFSNENANDAANDTANDAADDPVDDAAEDKVINDTPQRQDNPVPIRMAPRQLPGVYMILCLVNNKRYYGESKNVSARLSQHKSSCCIT